MKRLLKVLTLVLGVLAAITVTGVKADLGYIYTHENLPVYSTVGLSTSLDNIHTVISEGWTLSASDFTSPSDLFIYTDPLTKVDTIYVVDSVSNKLFVFDGNLKQIDEVSRFEIRQSDFTDSEIAVVNTRDKDTSTKSVDFLANTNNTAFTDRTDIENYYIDLCGVSGVYRAVRPVYDADGFKVRGETEDVIFLCDTTNEQIVIVDTTDYHVLQVVSSPTSIAFSGKTFKPTRVVTDTSGMMYVISDGVYEGIMQLAHTGEFSCFVGTNYTTLTFWNILSRNFMSQEQLEQEESTVVSTSFLSLAMDSTGFIYATSGSNTTTSNTKMIKRLNPNGDDVLTRNGYHVPCGDVVYVKTSTDSRVKVGASKFTAIAVNDYGMYTVADTNTGRLFTYDNQGYLLYISAGNGSELSDLNSPVAIQYQGENLLVLDKSSQSIIVFKPTDFGAQVNLATQYYYNGDLTASADAWKEIESTNPMYEYAYIGIGKSLLYEGRYAEAMANFKLGYDAKYYSKAYKYLRDATVKQYFVPVALVLLALIAWRVIHNAIKRKKNKGLESDSGAGDE